MNFAATGGSNVIWGETGNFSTNVIWGENVIWGTSATFTSGSSQAEAMSVFINGDKSQP